MFCKLFDYIFSALLYSISLQGCYNYTIITSHLVLFSAALVISQFFYCKIGTFQDRGISHIPNDPKYINHAVILIAWQDLFLFFFPSKTIPKSLALSFSSYTGSISQKSCRSADLFFFPLIQQVCQHELAYEICKTGVSLALKVCPAKGNIFPWEMTSNSFSQEIALFPH